MLCIEILKDDLRIDLKEAKNIADHLHSGITLAEFEQVIQQYIS